MQKLIGIIMPCYYASEYARKALTMLSWQTKKEYIKVYLVNNCSPNTNCDYQDLLDEFSNDLDIIYLKTEKDLGPGIARQLAMDNCDCDWVMFHDDDDMLNNPYVIEAFVNEILSLPENHNVAQIRSNHYQFWPDVSFRRCQSIMTGELCNLKFIKDNNIRFYEGFHEEDTLFNIMFYYYTKKLNSDMIELEQKYPYFLGYTKMRNYESLCCNRNQTKFKRYEQILLFYKNTLHFYSSLPEDEFTINYIREQLPKFIKSFEQSSLSSLINLNLTTENKHLLYEFHTLLHKLVLLNSDIISDDMLTNYYNFVISKL